MSDKTPEIVYDESIKRDLKRRLIYEYRFDERLKTKKEESTHLTDTGLVVELEHLKTKRLVYYYESITLVYYCLLLIDKARVRDKTYT